MRILVKQSLAILAVLAASASPPETVTRPDLNGTRVRSPGTATVDLIDNGFRQAVPHVAAYEALFREWECIVEDLDVDAIRLGDPLGTPPSWSGSAATPPSTSSTGRPGGMSPTRRSWTGSGSPVSGSARYLQRS